MTARAIVCALLLAVRAQAAVDPREVDPTRAGAIAEPSRAGALLRTTTLPLLPDVRVVDAAAWAAVVHTRVAVGREGTTALAARTTTWRTSADRALGTRLRAGLSLARTGMRAPEAGIATRRSSAAATVAWIDPARGDRRWVRVCADAEHAWGAVIGWATAPLGERTGAELGCAVSTGALEDGVVSAGVRVAASAALALTRSITLDVGAENDPPAVTWRLTWTAHGVRGEVERRSVLGFGDVRSWGGAWTARP